MIKEKKTYCFDLDGTICTNTEGDYKSANPYQQSVDLINKLFDAGNYIYIQTARGFTTGIDWRLLTENQLKKWGVRYHKLLFNKATADVYVDDKSINALTWQQEAKDPLKLLHLIQKSV